MIYRGEIELSIVASFYHAPVKFSIKGNIYLLCEHFFLDEHKRQIVVVYQGKIESSFFIHFMHLSLYSHIDIKYKNSNSDQIFVEKHQ